MSTWQVVSKKVLAIEEPRKSTLAYRALVLFSLIYYLRPEDFIPGLDAIPIGKSLQS